MKKLVTIILLIFSFSCQNRDDVLNDEKVFIEPEFQKYIDRFVDEAKNQGVEVDLIGLSALFVDGPIQEIYCGYGYSDYENSGLPLMQVSKGCWEEFGEFENNGEMFKEGLIFHELGHAILRRKHDYSLLPDGSVKTLMGDAIAYSHNKDLHKRDYYISELFNENEPIPEWAKE